LFEGGDSCVEGRDVPLSGGHIGLKVIDVILGITDTCGETGYV
jgi:hypothetical protein